LHARARKGFGEVPDPSLSFFYNKTGENLASNSRKISIVFKKIQKNPFLKTQSRGREFSVGGLEAKVTFCG